jgi:hypothetical protein
VLYQMGIYPNILTFRLDHPQRFSSLEEAERALAPQAKAESDEQRDVLRIFLKGALREDEGGLMLPRSSVRVKMWWEMGSESIA